MQPNANRLLGLCTLLITLCSASPAEEAEAGSHDPSWTVSMIQEFEAAAAAMRALLKARAAGDRLGEIIAEHDRDNHRARFLEARRRQGQSAASERDNPFRPGVLTEVRSEHPRSAAVRAAAVSDDRPPWDLYARGWGMYASPADPPRLTNPRTSTRQVASPQRP